MADVRNLANGASSEASDVHARLRAHTKSLEALRKTQVDQGKEMRQGFTKVDRRFKELEAKVDDGFTEMRDGFSKLKVGQVQITTLLNTMLENPDGTDTSSEGAGG